MSGPPPTPTYLKLLRGNPGKQRLNKREPQPGIAVAVPAPPKFLSEYAKEEWRRTAPEAHALHLLTRLDTTMFAVYCESFGRWRALVEALEADAKADPEYRGLCYRNDNGDLVANPLVRAASQAAKDMVRLAQEFGFTPASRTRIGVDAVPRPPSKFGNLLADFSSQDRDWPA
jgi:P27 family predicted phage terminase small subunit